MEKFAVRKAERFLEQGHSLVLPSLELVYAWNLFGIVGKQFKLIESMYVLTEKTMKQVEREKGEEYKDKILKQQRYYDLNSKSSMSSLQIPGSITWKTFV